MGITSLGSSNPLQHLPGVVEVENQGELKGLLEGILPEFPPYFFSLTVEEFTSLAFFSTFQNTYSEPTYKEYLLFLQFLIKIQGKAPEWGAVGQKSIRALFPNLDKPAVSDFFIYAGGMFFKSTCGRSVQIRRDAQGVLSENIPDLLNTLPCDYPNREKSLQDYYAQVIDFHLNCLARLYEGAVASFGIEPPPPPIERVCFNPQKSCGLEQFEVFKNKIDYNIQQLIELLEKKIVVDQDGQITFDRSLSQDRCLFQNLPEMYVTLLNYYLQYFEEPNVDNGFFEEEELCVGILKKLDIAEIPPFVFDAALRDFGEILLLDTFKRYWESLKEEGGRYFNFSCFFFIFNGKDHDERSLTQILGQIFKAPEELKGFTERAQALEALSKIYLAKTKSPALRVQQALRLIGKSSRHYWEDVEVCYESASQNYVTQLNLFYIEKWVEYSLGLRDFAHLKRAPFTPSRVWGIGEPLCQKLIEERKKVWFSEEQRDLIDSLQQEVKLFVTCSKERGGPGEIACLNKINEIFAKAVRTTSSNLCQFALAAHKLYNQWMVTQVQINHLRMHPSKGLPKEFSCLDVVSNIWAKAECYINTTHTPLVFAPSLQRLTEQMAALQGDGYFVESSLNKMFRSLDKKEIPAFFFASDLKAFGILLLLHLLQTEGSSYLSFIPLLIHLEQRTIIEKEEFMKALPQIQDTSSMQLLEKIYFLDLEGSHAHLLRRAAFSFLDEEGAKGLITSPKEYTEYYQKLMSFYFNEFSSFFLANLKRICDSSASKAIQNWSAAIEKTQQQVQSALRGEPAVCPLLESAKGDWIKTIDAVGVSWKVVSDGFPTPFQELIKRLRNASRAVKQKKQLEAWVTLLEAGGRFHQQILVPLAQGGWNALTFGRAHFSDGRLHSIRSQESGIVARLTKKVSKALSLLEGELPETCFQATVSDLAYISCFHFFKKFSKKQSCHSFVCFLTKVLHWSAGNRLVKEDLVIDFSEEKEGGIGDALLLLSEVMSSKGEHSDLVRSLIDRPVATLLPNQDTSEPSSLSGERDQIYWSDLIQFYAELFFTDVEESVLLLSSRTTQLQGIVFPAKIGRSGKKPSRKGKKNNQKKATQLQHPIKSVKIKSLKILESQNSSWGQKISQLDKLWTECLNETSPFLPIESAIARMSEKLNANPPSPGAPLSLVHQQKCDELALLEELYNHGKRALAFQVEVLTQKGLLQLARVCAAPLKAEEDRGGDLIEEMGSLPSKEVNPSVRVDIGSILGEVVETLLQKGGKNKAAPMEGEASDLNYRHQNAAYHVKGLAEALVAYEAFVKKGDFSFTGELFSAITLHVHDIFESLGEEAGANSHSLESAYPEEDWIKQIGFGNLWVRYPHLYHQAYIDETEGREWREFLVMGEESPTLERHKALVGLLNKAIPYLVGLLGMENNKRELSWDPPIPSAENRNFSRGIHPFICALQEEIRAEMQTPCAFPTESSPPVEGSTLTIHKLDPASTLKAAYSDVITHLSELDGHLKLIKEFPDTLHTLHTNGVILHIQFLLEHYYLAQHIREHKVPFHCPSHKLSDYEEQISWYIPNLSRDLNIGTGVSYMDFSEKNKERQPLAKILLKRGYQASCSPPDVTSPFQLQELNNFAWNFIKSMKSCFQ